MSLTPRSIPMAPEAAEVVARFKAPVVDEVCSLVADHDVVVVGMGWNPHVKRARKALDDAGIPYHYHEIGNYAGLWRERLAIKILTGWPTFPQVFVKGTLVGGADETQAALDSGRLRERLDA
ncbi:MAG: glutaredoxin [Myxococcota bacterium]